MNRKGLFGLKSDIILDYIVPFCNRHTGHFLEIGELGKCFYKCGQYLK